MNEEYQIFSLHVTLHVINHGKFVIYGYLVLKCGSALFDNRNISSEGIVQHSVNKGKMLSVFLTLALICGCSCYPTGAPESACNTMTPSHGVPPQNTSSPYVIQFSSSNFSIDSNFTVTISSKDGNTSFKGFLVEVFTDQPKSSQLKESEFKVPENAHPTCNGGATHSNANIKHVIELQWQPTTSFTGKVKFRATIVQSYTVFWKNVESEYLSVDYTAPSTSPSDVTTISHPIITTSESPSDLPRCEPGFGCFKACPMTTCEAVVIWRRSGNFVDFKIIARLDQPNNRWVAIGFSPTGKMPKTSVIMCLDDNGKLRVEEGVNRGYSFGPLSNKTQGLTNISASVVGGTMKCSFSRQINVSGSVESIYSLTKKYFLLLGNGPILGGTPSQHEQIPAKSQSRVDFLVNENVGSDEPSMTLYKLHGSLMILSWMFLSSVAIITARYFKSEWKDMMPCGVKVWFAVHRTLMSLVFIITTASFIIIFIQVGSLLQETDGDVYVRYHPALGITVMALCVANPVMALFRCDPGHKYRHVFHYSHMFVGTAAQILSAIAIYFGVNLEKSNTPEEASYIVIAYIINYVIIEVVLECQKYFRRNEVNQTETLILLRSTANVPQQKSQKHQVNSFKLLVLAIHFVCMVMYSMVLIYFVATA